jgi:(1->4)-alpha-D-glucan 1-alpha-D-glucosylmutase
VLSEIPERWREAVTALSSAAERHRGPAGPDRNAEYLLWQTLVGAWPIDADRAAAYLEKATREAKQQTSWTDPVPAYDEALAGFVRGVLGDPALVGLLEEFVAEVVGPGRVTSLSQKLLQLVMPGVPDVYQGTEREDLSLVDPDNRRPVDFDGAAQLLGRLDAGGPLPDPAGDDGAAKLLVVSRALRLRRERPEAFGPESSYAPLHVEGSSAPHLVGVLRDGTVAALAPRLVAGLHAVGGWGDTTVLLPEGRWADRMGGGTTDGGRVRVGDLLGRFPLALLVMEDS